MTLSPDDLADPRAAQLPAAISSLIDGAAARFDTDRAAARRYLLRASAILRAARAPGPEGESSSGLKSPAGALATWQVNRVLDYIDSHLTEKITLRDLARLIDVSVGRLCRAFKVSVGVSPYRFIARKRVELACGMLKTSPQPLSQVAISCGLCDQSHFSRFFRQATGMSPAAWRRVNAVGPIPGFAPRSTRAPGRRASPYPIIEQASEVR